MLPAIVFCFSRKECELLAAQTSRASRKAVAATAGNPGERGEEEMTAKEEEEEKGVDGATAADDARGSRSDAFTTRPQATRAAAARRPLNFASLAARAQIEALFDGAVDTLAQEDAELPQVRRRVLRAAPRRACRLAPARLMGAPRPLCERGCRVCARCRAQVVALRRLLRRGVGVHHSGMLPVLRELVEILFAEGLLQVRSDFAQPPAT